MKHARPSKEVAGAKAIISECQKKTEDSLEGSDMVSWYLDLFSGKGLPPKLVTNHLANLMVSIPQVPKYHPKKIAPGAPTTNHGRGHP